MKNDSATDFLASLLVLPSLLLPIKAWLRTQNFGFVPIPKSASFHSHAICFQELGGSVASNPKLAYFGFVFGFVPNRLSLFSTTWWLRTSFFNKFLRSPPCFETSSLSTRRNAAENRKLKIRPLPAASGQKSKIQHPHWETVPPMEDVKIFSSFDS